MKKLIIIDTFALLFRTYHAIKSNLKAEDGTPSGLIYGMANFILNLPKKFECDYLVFALESQKETKRSQIYPDYKANRGQTPQDFLIQLPVCLEMVNKMGYMSISCDGYEADDVIASIVKSVENKDIFVQIITGDKDIFSLIKDNKVEIFDFFTSKIYRQKDCFQKFGVYPNQICDYLSLLGDSSDNIPGVSGIGAKTAAMLLQEFGTMDGIYQNLEKIKSQSQVKKLQDGKDMALFSRNLVKLEQNLPIPDITQSQYWQHSTIENITDILRKFSINSIIKRANIQNTNTQLTFSFQLLNSKDRLFKILQNLTPTTEIAFDTETDDVDTKVANIVGFSFCFDEQNSYYVPIAHKYLGVGEQISKDDAKMAINSIFNSHVVGHNLKFDFAVVEKNFGIKTPSKYCDTMILAWLDNPEDSVGMDSLAKKLFKYETIKFKDIVKKGENFSSVSLDIASKYGAQDAFITLKFYKYFLKVLPQNIWNIARNIEFKFIQTLLKMENNGIKIDKNLLNFMVETNNKTIEMLVNQIYELAQEKFNINSTQQLSKILFHKLSLNPKHKTKFGFSTDEKTLIEIKNDHPIIEKILDYREIYKLQSTYCKPLLELSKSNKDSRIYTNFIHTGTSTGRLSSKNPNLQNIPARTKYATKLRECFISKEGFSLVGLDYSQIELRLLAHFSKDSALIKAFKNDEDIHARTAINIFGSCDDTARAIAKSINFGLIYGMGVNKLSNELEISKKEASDYIQKYFSTFPTVKDFLNNIKALAHQNGYVQTITGRYRKFDFHNATQVLIAAYEREAVNTIFQGSAADIIKMAMIKIDEKLDENSKMLLQIHDELIFEVKDDMVEEFAINTQKIMQEIYKLEVPLKTSLNISKNWGSLK